MSNPCVPTYLFLLCTILTVCFCIIFNTFPLYPCSLPHLSLLSNNGLLLQGFFSSFLIPSITLTPLTQFLSGCRSSFFNLCCHFSINLLPRLFILSLPLPHSLIFYLSCIHLILSLAPFMSPGEGHY